MKVIETLYETIKDSAVGAVGSFVAQKVRDKITKQLEETDWERLQANLRKRVEEANRAKAQRKPKPNYIKVTRLDK